MSRISGSKRNKLYDFLSRRDGEFCFIGGEPGTRDTLVIDHWNNDNSNNDLANLHLICRSMNAVKNPRGRDRRHKLQSLVCVRENVDAAVLQPPRTISAEFLKNQKAEPAFNHWLFREVVRLGTVPVDDVVDGGAYVARCSQVTIHRYLKKATFREALYHFVEDPETKKKFVELKPRWSSFRQKEDEPRLLNKQANNWKDDVIRGAQIQEKVKHEKKEPRTLPRVGQRTLRANNTGTHCLSGSFPDSERTGVNEPQNPATRSDF